MIICKDAIEFLKDTKDDYCDAVITSPPYNIGANYIDSKDNRLDYIEWSMEWIKEALRVSTKGIMLNIGSKVSDRNQLHILLGEIAKQHIIQNEIIWVKSISIADKTTGHFKPVNSKRYTNNTHELILHITNSLSEVDKLAVGVPFEDKSNIARFSANTNDLRCRGSTWFLPYKTRTEKLEHPATYPVELAEMMIKFIGAKSIIDPFMGSGTSAIAAQNLDIEYTGCDISQFYVDMSKQRLISVAQKSV